MSLSQYDPRDVALWTPGSVTVNRADTGKFGRPSEETLILHALEGLRASRQSRRKPLRRLRLMTAALRNA